jgi:hypothetical protein
MSAIHLLQKTKLQLILTALILLLECESGMIQAAELLTNGACGQSGTSPWTLKSGEAFYENNAYRNSPFYSHYDNNDSCLWATETQTMAGPTLEQVFPARSSGVVALSFDFNYSGTVGDFRNGVILRDSTGTQNVLIVSLDYGATDQLQLLDATGTLNLCTVVTGLWYHVQLYLDLSAKTYSGAIVPERGDPILFRGRSLNFGSFSNIGTLYITELAAKPHGVNAWAGLRFDNFSLEDNVEYAVINAIGAVSDMTVGSEESASLAKIISTRQPTNNGYAGVHRFGINSLDTQYLDLFSNTGYYIYNLMARTGVNSARTNDSFWALVDPEGDGTFDLSKVQQLHNLYGSYGWKSCWIAGYAPAFMNLSPGTIFSAHQDQYNNNYSVYLQTLLDRYKSTMQYLELANEVDATESWYNAGNSTTYARDAGLAMAQRNARAPEVKVLAYASTYARFASARTFVYSWGNVVMQPWEGRPFVDASFTGVNNTGLYGYSLHYCWQTQGTDSQKGFTKYFKDKMTAAGTERPLVNSEEGAYGPQANTLKATTRALYLYGFESVYHYPPKEYAENDGNIIKYSFFDSNWRTKKRLVAYKAACDAMKYRKLVGMSDPNVDVEAYVLDYETGYVGIGGWGPTYAIILWRNGGQGIESWNSSANADVPAVNVAGFSNVVSAWTWDLQTITFDAAAPTFSVGRDPIIVYCKNLPSWGLQSASTWMANKVGLGSQDDTTITTVTINSPSKVTWSNANGETGSSIERKTGSTGTYAQIGTVAANVTTFWDTSIAPSTSYVYRVKTIYSDSYMYSNEQSITSPAFTTLTNENFNGTASGSLPSGWTPTAPANTTVNVQSFPSASNKSIKLYDNSTTGLCSAEKTFTAATDWLFASFSFYASANGASFQLRSGSTVAVDLLLKSGNLVYRNASGTETTIMAYSINTWYSVKIVPSVSLKTFDLYVGGVLKLSGAPFRNTSLTSMDRINFGTDSASKSTVYIDDVVIQK